MIDPLTDDLAAPTIEIHGAPAILTWLRADLLKAMRGLHLVLIDEAPDKLVFRRTESISDDQTPLELVRLAALLPERANVPVPEAERIRCLKCNAVASIHEEKCQWCGDALKMQTP